MAFPEAATGGAMSIVNGFAVCARLGMAMATAFALGFCPGCGGSAPGTEAGTPPAPIRLQIQGTKVLGQDGLPILLHGANLRDNLLPGGQSGPMVTLDEAEDLATQLRFNFVRLRISFEQGNRDDTDPSGFSATLRQTLAEAVERLRSKHIWILLEMRTDDATANASSLYDPAGADFGHFRTAWTWIARTYRNTDYIAGYGLLAEPSPEKAGLDPVPSLIQFQAALMGAITAEDPRTPFFIGPAFNYDTMGYRWDGYYLDAQFAPYRGRLIYEVNLLMPKPWIVDGSVPPGVDPGTAVWPQPPLSDFTPLLAIADGENGEHPRDDEKIFNRRRQEPINFPKLMTREFLTWYLGFAKAFSDRHQVPMVVDQFGASMGVNTVEHPSQQLSYELGVIEAAEASGMGWCRWIYQSNSTDRSIAGNQAVHDFYQAVGASRKGP
jgi:hypothetical protein